MSFGIQHPPPRVFYSYETSGSNIITFNQSHVDVIVTSFSALGSSCGTLLFACYLLLPIVLLYRELTSAYSKPEPKQQEVQPTPHQAPQGHGVRHMSVIMDGNRRFGVREYGDALRGHHVGGDTLMDFIEWSIEADIQMLTVYAFSTENWNRPSREVNALMTLFTQYFEKIRAKATEFGIRIRFLSSEPEKLADSILRQIESIEEETKNNTTITVNVCISYGGRSAIVRAARTAAHESSCIVESSLKDCLCRCVTENNKKAPTALSPQEVEVFCNPDLMLRTSKELRLSNFLLFESAYSEFFFVEDTWPDMTRGRLFEILEDFATKRNRRLGR